ncbi:hypothetical protein ACLOAV_007847 [Pseudogymnoascus australis]
MPNVPLSPQNASVTIPTTLISLETLHYVGLSSEKANDLWSRWTSWWPTEPYGPRRETDPDDGFGLVVSFHDFIIGWSVTNRVDAVGTDDDLKWPQIRHTSATVHSRNRDQQLGLIYSPTAPDTPGYTTLFKPVDLAQTTNLLTQTGTLSSISTLLIPTPSDFSGGTRCSFHLTPSHDLATLHAAYAILRAPTASIAILRLRIPNAAIANLAAPDIQRVFFPSSEWIELVWRSRTRSPLPQHLRKYRGATLVVGTRAYRADFVYQGMKMWEGVGEENVLGVGEGDVEYVFSGEEEGCEFLTRHVEGAEVVPFPVAALEEFLADHM